MEHHVLGGTVWPVFFMADSSCQPSLLHCISVIEIWRPIYRNLTTQPCTHGTRNWSWLIVFTVDNWQSCSSFTQETPLPPKVLWEPEICLQSVSQEIILHISQHCILFSGKTLAYWLHFSSTNYSTQCFCVAAGGTESMFELMWQMQTSLELLFYLPTELLKATERFQCLFLMLLHIQTRRDLVLFLHIPVYYISFTFPPTTW